MRRPLGCTPLALALALSALAARDASATPAASLVMPFDAAAGSVSFLVASHPAGAASAAGVRTHWSFWDESCTHAAEAILCLAADGSVIVDPTRVPAIGGVIDLAGRRGFVTVTAYEAPSGCDAADARRGALARRALLGSFTLADLGAGVSFGGSAIALDSDADGAFVELGAAADASPTVQQRALRLQSFDPDALDVSRVILLALREHAGHGGFAAVEVGPVAPQARLGARARFAGRDGTSVVLPDAELGCATFTSLRRDDLPSLLPRGGPGDLVASGGFLALEDPRIGAQPLGRTTVLLGFHGQAVASFGVLAVGDATIDGRTQPTPGPSPAATPTPRPSSTSSTRPSPTSAPTPGPSTATPTPGPATPRPTGSVVAPTGTPDAPPAVTPTSTPTPRATPSGSARPSPTASGPTPSPVRTPQPSPTPRPGTTASPSPGATATPAPTLSPRGTASPSTCTTLTIEVRTTFGSPPPDDVSGIVATVAYPAAVAIPGTGSEPAVASRVGNVSGVNGLFQATDTGTELRAGLISVSAAIPPGPFVRIQFDCTSGAVPSPAAFGCSLEASTLAGALVPGAACSTEIVP